MCCSFGAPKRRTPRAFAGPRGFRLRSGWCSYFSHPSVPAVSAWRPCPVSGLPATQPGSTILAIAAGIILGMAQRVNTVLGTPGFEGTNLLLQNYAAGKPASRTSSKKLPTRPSGDGREMPVLRGHHSWAIRL